MKAQTLYKAADINIMDEILEYYKCHFTIKETAKHFGYNYGQINGLFYKFKLKKISKYNRLSLIQGGINASHSARA